MLAYTFSTKALALLGLLLLGFCPHGASASTIPRKGNINIKYPDTGGTSNLDYVADERGYRVRYQYKAPGNDELPTTQQAADVPEIASRLDAATLKSLAG